MCTSVYLYLPLTCGVPPAQVMAISAHENMTMIAVGFKDGTVLLIRGNITRDRLSRQRLLHEESTAGVYITGECQLPCSSHVLTSRGLVSSTPS